MNTNRTPDFKRIFRRIGIVLIVVLLLAALGVFLVSRMLTFDETGAHVVDRYGVLAQENQLAVVGSGESAGSGEAVVQTVEETPEEQPQQTTDETAVRAVSVSADDLTDSDIWSALRARTADGMVNTVILDIKKSGGELNIPVETSELDSGDLQSRDADAIAGCISELKNAGVSVIGRISCFDDQQAADANSDLAIQFSGGGTWLDYDSKRWLDPTNPSAVSYLGDVAVSAQALGCSEILLTDFTFPPRGHIGRAELDSEAESQAAALLEALQQIQSVLGETPVSLTANSASDLVDLSDTAANEGLDIGDIGALLKAAAKLYVPADDAAHADEITAQLKELGVEAAIIPQFTDLSAWQEQSGSAVLDTTDDGYLLDEMSE